MYLLSHWQYVNSDSGDNGSTTCMWDAANMNLSDSKVHGANMGHTWVLSASGGPHVGLMNLAICAMFTKIYDAVWCN